MRKLVKALGLMAGLVAAPMGAGAETLADAMVAAYKSSHLLDQNQAVLRAADEDAAIAMANLRPVVNFTAQGGWRKYDNDRISGQLPAKFYESASLTLDVTASVVIWAGGRNQYSLEAAREQVLSTRASLINIEQQVLLGAVSAYVDVRLQLEIVAVLP